MVREEMKEAKTAVRVQAYPNLPHTTASQFVLISRFPSVSRWVNQWSQVVEFVFTVGFLRNVLYSELLYEEEKIAAAPLMTFD